MTLNYPPGAFAQSIRMRRQKLPSKITLLIVEGTTDKSAMSTVLHDDVYLVPGRGKDTLLQAYEQLDGESVENCLFLIDCDGEDNTRLLGKANLIVSELRDVEADLVYRLRALQKVSIGLISEKEDSVASIRQQSHEIEEYGLRLTGAFGIVLDVARRQGLKLRLFDTATNRKRRLELRDMPSLGLWLLEQRIPTLSELACAMGDVLSWSAAECANVASHAAAGGAKECRKHARRSCSDCISRRFSNGHSLVEIYAYLLSQQLGVVIQARDIARSLRSSVDLRAVSEWSTAIRMNKWQTVRGVNLLADDIIV
jgi:hypothetical protein